jgi:catechol 2,3-dioxygenase-like lactoylglutathione lyase family enzyme
MAQEEFRLARIGVVMLGVADVKRALAFYREQLGLKVQSEIPGFVFLDGGGVTLALSEPLARAAGASAGATDIVFSVDDVTHAYEELRARRVVFENEPRNVTGSMWAANFRDPDGHLLSIFGPEHKS